MKPKKSKPYNPEIELAKGATLDAASYDKTQKVKVIAGKVTVGGIPGRAEISGCRRQLKIMTDFKFDLNAKKVRFINSELLSSLEKYAEKVNFRYFPTTEYDKWREKIVGTGTFCDRFGSWKKALKIIGIEGGRERKYSPEELIQNLENIWKEIGYPPGKRQLVKYGQRISERPYNRNWGSVRIACQLVANHHDGKISRQELLNGISGKNIREAIPLNIRWKVLKNDNYSCRKCGQSPAKNNNVELEIDHILPIAKGGTNDYQNLQTLCRKCNQGKKDKE